MTNKAITRLGHDLQKLQKAQHTHRVDVHKLHSDRHDLKVDTRHLAKAKDEYKKDHKDLAHSRASLDHVRDARDAKLSALQATRQTAQAAYDASIDPATGVGDPTLQSQLGALQQQETDLSASYGAKVDASVAQVNDLKAQVAAGKRTITHEHAVISHDHQELKHDNKAVAHDHQAVHADRKQALKDLRPAEYQMGLKQTNQVRKELGLSKVDHAIRPAGPGHASATMKKLAAAGLRTAQSMGGYHSGGLCATGVSRSIASAMGLTVYGNGNQIDNNLPRSKFKELHVSLAEALKTPGLILTWEHTSTTLGAKYGHTAITMGDGHTSCSDFIENNTLAGGASRSGLKIFMPIG